MFQNYFGKSSFSSGSTDQANAVKKGVLTALSTFDNESQTAGGQAAYDAIIAGQTPAQAGAIGVLTAQAVTIKKSTISTMKTYSQLAQTAGGNAAYAAIMANQNGTAALYAGIAAGKAITDKKTAPGAAEAAGKAAGTVIMAGGSQDAAFVAGASAASIVQKSADAVTATELYKTQQAATAAAAYTASLRYYGNTIKNSSKPYVITLTGKVPVLNWRSGIEYKYNSCGCSSSCGSFTPTSDLAIESRDRGSTPYTEFFGKGNCGGLCGFKSQNEAWCLVPIDFITHIFGQGTGNGTIPSDGKQYSTPSALTLGITPFNKKLNTSDNTMSTLNPDIQNTGYFGNNGNTNRPTFQSISFNLPDPTEQIDIDSIIPYILLGYASTTYNTNIPGITAGPILNISVLNDYISKYLFTNVNGNPRIAFATDPTLTSNPNFYSSYLQQVITSWQGMPNTTYATSAQSYCSDINLTNKWCNTACKTTDASIAINCDAKLQTFCSKGGNGNLPTFSTSTVLPTTKVTQEILNAAFPNYSLYPATCGCQMPANYYQQLDIMSFQQMPSLGPETYSTLVKNGGVNGRPTCDPLTICRSGGSIPNKSDAAINCPTIAIQNCLQAASVNAGNIKDSSNIGNINQAINCIQNINGNNSNNSNNNGNNSNNNIPPPPPGTPPPSDKPKSYKTLIIIVVIIMIVLMLLFFLYMVLKH